MASVYDTCIAWAEQHMLSCPSKKLMHLDCPGCGLQRSTIALLKGDIQSSWHFYPPTLFIIATVVFLLLHLVFKFRHGAAAVKYLYIVATIVIFVNYIFKIFTNQLI